MNDVATRRYFTGNIYIFIYRFTDKINVIVIPFPCLVREKQAEGKLKPVLVTVEADNFCYAFPVFPVWSFHKVSKRILTISIWYSNYIVYYTSKVFKNHPLWLILFLENLVCTKRLTFNHV